MLITINDTLLKFLTNENESLKARLAAVSKQDDYGSGMASAMLSQAVDTLNLYADIENWELSMEGVVYKGPNMHRPHELAYLCRSNIVDIFSVLAAKGDRH